MRFCFILLVAFVFEVCPAGFAASPSASLDQEYEQVRKIAMRDPKVRRAFEDANKRLEAKIVEIDPALKGFKPGTARPAGKPPASAGAASVRSQSSNTRTAPDSAGGRSHVIAKGETLSSIAARYKVTVAGLAAANPRVDAKNLRIGQKLAIPSGAAKAAEPEPEKTGAWDWLKSKF